MKKTLRKAVYIAVLLVAWLVGTLGSRAETITGRFRYADFDPASNTSRLEPIRLCKVEVWGFRPRALGIWLWGKDADTTTDINGSISVGINFQADGVVYGLRITAQNYAAIVWPNNAIHPDPFFQAPGQPDGMEINRTAHKGSDILDFSYDFTDGWTPQHWSLAEAVRHGFDYVSARRDPAETDPLPQAGVQPGFVTTFYNYIQETLAINTVHVFEDFTILHEYGHFVEHHIGTFAAIPSTHDGCSAMVGLVNVNSPEHAWMEGFAEFFAQAVVSKNPPGTFQGHPGGAGTFTISDLENTPWTSCSGLPASITPDAIENNVAGVLWDLFDPVGPCGSSEAHDSLAGFDTQIIQIMDHEMDLPRWPNIFDFRDAWLARGLPAAPLLEILSHHGIGSPPPAPTLVCPADITVSAPANQCSTTVSFSFPGLLPSRRCATVSCDHFSGDSFRIGTTTVNCEAREAGAVIAICGFTVTVNSSAPLPNPNGTGLLGIYYDNIDLTAAKVARIEAVDFDWGLGAPAPGVDADTFSVRWSGRVVPRFTGLYTFYTVSDDGVRLSVDGRRIINNWTDHVPTEDNGQINLVAGQPYDIVMEFYENFGGAVAKLMWSSACQPKEIIPATHLLPSRLEIPNDSRPNYPLRDLNPRQPLMRLFGDAQSNDGWLKLTLANNSYGIAYIDNFSGSLPVFGFEARFEAALFGSLCCGGLPADGFSFNLVPKATVLPNPGYGQPAEEGLGEGLAINFDTWDNGGGEGPAIEVKWLGQIVASTPFQASQSPLGVTTAAAAVRDVVIDLKSDGKLNLSYGGVPIFQNLQTPYSPNVIGTPEWVLGARNGLANDNHWIRNLSITVTPPSISDLFNTGVDNNGNPLPDNSADLHYQLAAGGAMVGTPVAATASGGFPIGPWLPDNTDSGWIAPTPSTDGLPSSYYLYQTTCDLKGLDPSMAAIYGWVSADDFLAEIFINGLSTGQATASGASPFTYWQAFSITGGFQPGTNTITFLVFNSGVLANPSGLRVQMAGSAWSKPQLKLEIQHARTLTTLSWGSLPHKTYFVEHAADVTGPWFRDPVAGIFPGNYNAQFNDFQRRFADPVRFYRVIEAP